MDEPDDVPVDEVAIGNNEVLPLKWARYSRLIEPRGPFRASWLFDQIIQKKVRATVLIPRGKLRGVRIIDLQSLCALLEELVQSPGPCPKHEEE